MNEPVTRLQAAVRTLGVGLLSTVAAIHTIWTPHKLHEAPWVGTSFIVLAAGAVALAVVLALGGARLARLAWAAAVLVAATPIVGYVLTRLVALPQQEGLVGEWADELGPTSLAVEGLLLALAVVLLLALRREVEGRRRRASRLTPAGLVLVFVLIATATAPAPAIAHGNEEVGAASSNSAETGASAGAGRPSAASAGAARPSAANGGPASEPSEAGPPKTPTYLVVPSVAVGGLLTLGAGVALWRRSVPGPVGRGTRSVARTAGR